MMLALPQADTCVPVSPRKRESRHGGGWEHTRDRSDGPETLPHRSPATGAETLPRGLLDFLLTSAQVLLSDNARYYDGGVVSRTGAFLAEVRRTDGVGFPREGSLACPSISPGLARTRRFFRGTPLSGRSPTTLARGAEKTQHLSLSTPASRSTAFLRGVMPYPYDNSRFMNTLLCVYRANGPSHSTMPLRSNPGRGRNPPRPSAWTCGPDFSRVRALDRHLEGDGRIPRRDACPELVRGLPSPAPNAES